MLGSFAMVRIMIYITYSAVINTVTGQEYVSTGTSLCNNGEIRLFDGENFNQRKGRVEMCYNGVWGTVCADGWDEIATNIVCTQLGYENGKYYKIYLLLLLIIL
jgi:hypothetical protein